MRADTNDASIFTQNAPELFLLEPPMHRFNAVVHLWVGFRIKNTAKQILHSGENKTNKKRPGVMDCVSHVFTRSEAYGGVIRIRVQVPTLSRISGCCSCCNGERGPGREKRAASSREAPLRALEFSKH